MAEVEVKMALSIRLCVLGCVLGGAVGDSIGWPVELKSRQRILALTGGTGITGPVGPFPDTFKPLRALVLGDTTDDTEMHAALLCSLARRWRYDAVTHSQVARLFVEGYRASAIGYGPSTLHSLKEIDAGGRSQFELAQFPPSGMAKSSTTSVIGRGDGVAMRIAPLGLAHAFYGMGKLPLPTAYGLSFPLPSPEVPLPVNIPPLLNDVLVHGTLTHPHLGASFAAYPVAELIRRMLFMNDGDSWTGKQAHGHLQQVVDALRDAESAICDCLSSSEERFSGRVEARLLGQPDLQDCGLDDLARVFGTSCDAYDAVPLVLSIFIRHATDFRAGVLETVNVGGDTDTVAAMVGCLIGANVGVQGIPEEWLAALRRREELQKLADDFCRLRGI